QEQSQELVLLPRAFNFIYATQLNIISSLMKTQLDSARLHGSILPLELFLIVFKFVHQAHIDDLNNPENGANRDTTTIAQFPNNIASVCSYWHDIMLKNPDFWTLYTIDFDSPISGTDLVDLQLQSTQGRSLVIEIRSSKVFDSIQEYKQMGSVMSCLRPHLERFLELKIETCYSESLGLAATSNDDRGIGTVTRSSSFDVCPTHIVASRISPFQCVADIFEFNFLRRKGYLNLPMINVIRCSVYQLHEVFLRSWHLGLIDIAASERLEVLQYWNMHSLEICNCPSFDDNFLKALANDGFSLWPTLETMQICKCTMFTAKGLIQMIKDRLQVSLNYDFVFAIKEVVVQEGPAINAEDRQWLCCSLAGFEWSTRTV
ncbi:hypothetical protein BJ138DRAFT_1157644, partial [Hygrophoropsis aurantiaca]